MYTALYSLTKPWQQEGGYITATVGTGGARHGGVILIISACRQVTFSPPGFRPPAGSGRNSALISSGMSTANAINASSRTAVAYAVVDPGIYGCYAPRLRAQAFDPSESSVCASPTPPPPFAPRPLPTRVRATRSGCAAGPAGRELVGSGGEDACLLACGAVTGRVILGGRRGPPRCGGGVGSVGVLLTHAGGDRTGSGRAPRPFELMRRGKSEGPTWDPLRPLALTLPLRTVVALKKKRNSLWSLHSPHHYTLLVFFFPFFTRHFPPLVGSRLSYQSLDLMIRVSYVEQPPNFPIDASIVRFLRWFVCRTHYSSRFPTTAKVAKGRILRGIRHPSEKENMAQYIGPNLYQYY
jgi:hypothetical protein